MSDNVSRPGTGSVPAAVPAGARSFSPDGGRRGSHPVPPTSARSGAGRTASGHLETGRTEPGHTAANRVAGRLGRWLLADQPESAGYQGPHQRPREQTRTHPWWAVMCLSGVDYFSTLGYQPGIAALAAGSLAPLATLILIVVTLCGALPVYRWVAAVSPRGAGSIHMLEKLMPRWGGKITVLVLLGFACTDFMITITLSAADAATHTVENPLMPLHGDTAKLWITFGLIALLAAVFLKGFREAIAVAVVLVPVYLGLNVAVLAVGFGRLAQHPEYWQHWTSALSTGHANPVMGVALAFIVFPKLALGMSGYETGVSVMTQIHIGPHGETSQRIQGTRKLLTTAALIMAVLLAASSLVTTLLIPAQEFQAGGQANGRALAYVAHAYMGPLFGSVYDIVTILILWFAGASAMAGMLNLVPRYLPRYGMAPEWTRAVRPLIIVFAAIGLLITWLFDADVDAQGGAYATGVLVLMTSAAWAVTLSARHRGHPRLAVGFGIVTLVFVYTTVANVIERPDGIKIAAIFVLCILAVSFASRVWRSSELRIRKVTADPTVLEYLRQCRGRTVRLVPHKPDSDDDEDYAAKLAEERLSGTGGQDSPLLFVEVNVRDPSDFENNLTLLARTVGSHRIIHVDGASVATCLAGVALWVREQTGVTPHLYLEWSQGSPVRNFLRFLVWGQGQTATRVHEILRRAQPDDAARPVVHVM